MYPKAYIDFLVHFHGPRDYFECHEILEEHWKEQDPANRSSVWVGLIQIAVALYHHRTGNFTGAARMLTKAIKNTEMNKDQLAALSLDYAKLIQLLHVRLTEINSGTCYYSVNLPLHDSKLLETCIDQCNRLGFQWQEDSNLENNLLIYRHSLRDRSSIKKERETQLQVRKNKRPNS